MPAPPTELKQTERLTHIDNPGTDPGDYPARHAEAVSAVERLNNRINGWRALWTCVRQALATGTATDACK